MSGGIVGENNRERRKPADHANDVKDLVVGYAKQETVDPLKTLGRYLGFGAGGAIAVGIGCIFVLMSVLRGLQSIDFFSDNTDPSGGNFSFLPYLITCAIGAAMIGLTVMAISKDLRGEEDTK